MSRQGVNNVILLGNVGKDPVSRSMTSGALATNLSMATSEKWKDKTTGEARESTEWHTVVFFGPLAEIVSKYVQKGSKIYIEGKLRTRKWQDTTGADRYTTDILASEMQMLDSKKDSPSHSTPSTAENNPKRPEEDFDDDVPF